MTHDANLIAIGFFFGFLAGLFTVAIIAEQWRRKGE